jgi:hypothetical protein
MKPQSMRWQHEKTAAENARVFLPEVLLEYLNLGDRLAKHGVHPKELHQLRLATKHLRYGIEMFEPLFGPTVANLLLILRETQQRLGEISDATASEAWIHTHKLDQDAEIQAVLTGLEQRGATCSSEFGTFWQTHWGLPGLRDRWVLYLRRYAGRSRVRPVQPAPNQNELI